MHAGQLINAMIATAIWPLIEIAIFCGGFYALRLIDRGFTNDIYKTHMVSV